jgi:hypothetical protein
VLPQMMHLLLAIACTSPSTVTPEEGAPSALREATFEDEMAPVTVTETELTLHFAPEAAGFYELRAYRTDADGVRWVGAARELGAVLADAQTVTLPRLPPRADRGVEWDEHVVYAIALRAEDADAEPGLYVGLAAERLVYVGDNAPEGASPGWNLARGYDSGEPVWVPVTDSVVLDENLFGAATLALAGGTTVAIEPGTHLDLAPSEASDALSAYDTPIAPDWSVSLLGPPPLEALTETAPLGAVYTLYAYEDVGADNVRTDEPLVGSVCFGTRAARISWYAYAYDLPTALALQSVGARAGWDLSIDTPNGPSSLPVDDHGALTIQATCG